MWLTPTVEHVESLPGEGQLYLRVAEAVLRQALTPLSAREIVERGIDGGLFGDHVLGRTPEKSMQARLSVDILGRSTASVFARTGRGRFALRSTLGTTSRAALFEEPRELSEYKAVSRALQLPEESVLCSPSSSYLPILTFQGISTHSSETLARLLRQPTTYVARREVESNNSVKQFVTYVIIQCGHRILTFERSHLSRAAEFLRGSKCIGFGGHVSSDDLTIFDQENLGIESCAKREILEELSLSSGKGGAREGRTTTPAERDLVRDEFTSHIEQSPIELIGILNDDSSEVGRRHVAVVYRLWLDEWQLAKRIVKGESSIRALRWVDLTSDRIALSEFEYWSQLCLRKFYPSASLISSGLTVVNPSALRQAQVLVMAGRVGSGKSATAQYVAKKRGVHVVNSGKVLARLMMVGTLTDIGREKFQSEALKFIRKQDGPRLLARAIAADVRQAGGHAVVDGIRHLETLNCLKHELRKGVAVLFVQTPPDVSFEFYRSRERQDELSFSYRDFLGLYDAEVEIEITSLGRQADAYVYNYLGIDDMRGVIDSMLSEFPSLIKVPGTELESELADTQSSS